MKKLKNILLIGGKYCHVCKTNFVCNIANVLTGTRPTIHDLSDSLSVNGNLTSKRASSGQMGHVLSVAEL
jgi:hypothetical protein